MSLSGARLVSLKDRIESVDEPVEKETKTVVKKGRKITSKKKSK